MLLWLFFLFDFWLLARPNNKADTTNSRTKIKLITNTPITPALPQEAWAGQIKNANTGMANWTKAVINKVTLIPRDLNWEIKEPIIHAANTAQYIRLAGLFSLPIIPTEPFARPRKNIHPSPIKKAKQYIFVCVFSHIHTS